MPSSFYGADGRFSRLMKHENHLQLTDSARQNAPRCTWETAKKYPDKIRIDQNTAEDYYPAVLAAETSCCNQKISG